MSLSEVDVSFQTQRAAEWAEYFSIALDEWCKANGIEPKSILKDQLGIPDSIWSHLSAGTNVADKKWYATVYHHTNIPESDPRTLPPRLYKMPNGKTVAKERAMTEKEWQEWRTQHTQQNEPQAEEISLPTVEVPTPSIHLSPREIKPEVTPVTVRSKSKSREYRHLLQRRFDALLEGVMSEVIPRYPDPQDDGSIDQILWALKSVFEKLEKMEKSVRTQFAHEHGRTLTALFPYIEAYTLPDEKKREEVLSLIFDFTINGDTFHQEG